MLLAHGDAHGALSRYQRALSYDEDPSLTTMARLGAATCMERLGYLDGALAELDGIELPPEVMEARASRRTGRCSDLGACSARWPDARRLRRADDVGAGPGGGSAHRADHHGAATGHRHR